VVAEARVSLSGEEFQDFLNRADEGGPLGELDRLIGLDNVKTEIRQVANFISFQQRRRSCGLKDSDICLHMVFSGNPGTGKTRVARIVAETYRRLGVLSSGQLVETSRPELVAGYLGQTALKTKAVAERAIGGVLFIDEAYTLAGTDIRQDSFGQEAIDTLLKFMEDHRDDLAVIVAGYPEKMERFLSANPGLESRFSTRISFADYKPNELLGMFEQFCQEADYDVSPSARRHLSMQFECAYRGRDGQFGNGRMARNIFDLVRKRLATRVATTDANDRTTLMMIEEDDVLPITLW
jgi:SpoVK/Ycf46/Vps4 family AAA+-type ATPase